MTGAETFAIAIAVAGLVITTLAVRRELNKWKEEDEHAMENYERWIRDMEYEIECSRHLNRWKEEEKEFTQKEKALIEAAKSRGSGI